MTRLIPDVDTPIVINGQVVHQTEAQLATLFPRVNGTGSLTISGTVANNDVISVTFTSKLFAAPVVVSVTMTGADTLVTAADKLAAAIAANAILAPFGLTAEADPTAGKIDFVWPGPLGSNVVISAAASPGAEAFAVVQITGGSGAIIPNADYRFVYNGQVVYLKAGHRITLGPDALAALLAGVAQAPIN